MARKKAEQPDAGSYERHKAAAGKRQAALSLAGRDIGDLPEVANPLRKASAERDFRAFCDSYFPHTFCLPWSPDHLKVIGKIQTAVLDGGLFALAMPRGSGKTSLCEVACVWAMLYGHREFVCLVGPEEGSAVQMLDSIKIEFETNDLLEEDFPEAVFPIKKLDGIANRCKGQLCHGEQTRITWTEKEIILPTIAGSKASGVIVKVAGITGRVRGMKHKRPDGKSVRPELVIIDDPQTDESSRSPSQCATREGILSKAILGLAGPGKKISGIMPCTVIEAGDMADNILDRKKHPEWNGERTKMVYAFPTNDRLWQQYGELRADGFRRGDAGAEATEFYRQNREAMDAGSIVAWPERYNPDELSAIQNAMNWKLRDEAAFLAEGQNEPKVRQGRDDDLSAEFIAAKTNNYERRVVPLSAVRLTSFIDVQGDLLYWTVCAWEEDFGGYVVDYNAYPEQGRDYFTLRDATPTLRTVCPGAGLEGAIYAGLEKLTTFLLGMSWRRDDDADLRIERCLIDANWGESTDVVYRFCRESPFAGILLPSHGKGFTASSVPMHEYRQQPGDRVGQNWRIPGVQGKRQVRHVTFDANWWKSFFINRLAVQLGDRGCLSLFGSKPHVHRLFADHLKAEFRVKTEGRGREVDEWKLRVERPDNHWFDCAVGCAVAASIQGCKLPGIGGEKPLAKPKKRTLGAAMAARPEVKRL